MTETILTVFFSETRCGVKITRSTYRAYTQNSLRDNHSNWGDFRLGD